MSEQQQEPDQTPAEETPAVVVQAQAAGASATQDPAPGQDQEEQG